MKRGRRILVLLACGVVALVTALVWPREREPEYQGKKLSEWVDGLVVQPFTIPEEPPFFSRPAEAISQIGTNGLPLLVKWVSYERPRWLERVPTRVRAVFGLDGAHSRREKRAGNAVDAFKVLGASGAQAIPGLILASTHSAGVDAWWRVQRAIEAIQREGGGCRELIECARARDAPTAQIGLGWLMNKGHDRGYADQVSVAGPVFVGCSKNPDASVRYCALCGLREWGIRTDEAVACFRRGLSDPDPEVRAVARVALGGDRLQLETPAVLRSGHLGAGTNVEHRTGNVEH